ncbi:hypothetical protein CYMTET_33900 [Cymbomonas tetramitiformis]|uniref:PPPDE domain-containing protein n=1 Tax=Cymbomonas tetramitiformis TaxID=36881 RepID=A0AAE0KQE8_9CHLO|nr:hypothetical protein CYMTET_33900 [Cymbomonas tetramitiformis]
MAGAGGLFHAAIEVYGSEYSFGYVAVGTGVFMNEPTKCAMHEYRQAVTLGETKLSKVQVDELLQQLVGEYSGTSYDLLTRNCCSFSDDLAHRLGIETGIPSWINRFANIGAAAVSTTAAAVDTAVAKAQAIDDHYGISQKAQEVASTTFARAEAVDKQYNISEKAREVASTAASKVDAVDKQYSITEKAKAMSQTAAQQARKGLNAMTQK